nr:hypothetical protein CFP56_12882 [Quercus suber]
MIRPGIRGRDADPTHRDRPWQDPEDVTHKALVEVPAWTGGEQDGGELGGDGVENVAPVDGTPHLLCDQRDGGVGRDVVGEASSAVKREEEAERHFNRECDHGGKQRWTDNG